ncbi:MAG: amidohydrolase [Pseudomonadales bacterium]
MPGPDILIRNATIVTMNTERTIHKRGYVAIKDGLIQAVGNQQDCPYESAEKIIEADGKAVLPGFINSHAHVMDTLSRGGLSDDRMLYDWLFNVTYPCLSTFGPKEVEAAASIYSVESLRAGVTTFVDNQDFATDRFDMAADGAIAVYRKFGTRVIYARMFMDLMPDNLNEYIGAIFAKGPSDRLPWENIEKPDEAIARIEQLMRRHNGTADGRIHVWPSPGVAIMCSRESLLKAKDLARKYGVMVTSHIAESEHDRHQAGVSTIEYLATVGYLGPDVLAAHCVQLDSDDIRIMSQLDVKVANNASCNMFLGNGIAPVSEMLAAGMTVGIGTDDANANNTANILADMKVVALSQKAKYENAVAITAEKVLEMATIDGARAIGMEKDIGSIEVGKKADIITLDLSAPHLVPKHNIPSVLVYQALGNEVETVMVDGRILMENRVLTMLEEGEERLIIDSAHAASERAVELGSMERRTWQSYKAI